MTNIDQKQFLGALQAKEADIAAGLGRRDGLAVQAEPDVFDEIQNVIDRALLVRNLDHGSDLLREVRRAVERIASGEYGSCLECGEEINPKRLAAVPWAALCLRCQEHADANSAARNREWPPSVETIVSGDRKLRPAIRRAAAAHSRELDEEMIA